jgi:hypothetical protein
MFSSKKHTKKNSRSNSNSSTQSPTQSPSNNSMSLPENSKKNEEEKKICNVSEENYCQDKSSGGHQGTIFSPDKETCAKIVNLEGLEYKFYKNLDPSSSLYEFLPKYNDVCYRDEKPYIMLENLKAGLEEPIAIDIKFGFQTSSSQIMKIKKLTKKFIKRMKHGLLDRYTNSSKFGFRVEGAKLGVKLSKLELMKQDIFKTFSLYFAKDKDDKALMSFIKNLKKFINKANNEEFRNYRLIGASILFIYDGKNPNETKFKIIDFDNSIILDKQNKKKIQKNINHANKNIIAFTNLLNTLNQYKFYKHEI